MINLFYTEGRIKVNCTLFALPQLDARPTGYQEVAGSIPRRDGNILSWRFDHEIFSTVTFPFC